jgi:hypothetical protein
MMILACYGDGFNPCIGEQAFILLPKDVERGDDYDAFPQIAILPGHEEGKPERECLSSTRGRNTNNIVSFIESSSNFNLP